MTIHEMPANLVRADNPAGVQRRDKAAEPVCAACKGSVDDLAPGRDPEELCDTCYHDLTHPPSDKERIAALEWALGSLIAACDRGRRVTKPGCDTGGQTIEANIKASCVNGVDAWAIEEARDTLENPQPCPDRVVEAVVADLRARSARGLSKYATTLSDSGLSHREFLQHAYEEALDFANYLKGAMAQQEVGHG